MRSDIPLIEYTFPRHATYDFHNDGKLSADELFLVPAHPGNPELQGILEYSHHPDNELAIILTALPDSKVARVLSRSFTKPRKIFEEFAYQNPERAVQVLLAMKESPYENNQYSAEGFHAYSVMETLPDDLQATIRFSLESLDAAYLKNIDHWVNIKTLTPNKSDFHFTSDLVEANKQGDLPIYSNNIQGRKIFQGQFAVSGKGANVLTFGVNDCVAVAFLDENSNKAITHLDTGMDIEDSLDCILFEYIKTGGDLSKTKVAIIGGFESSKDLIWKIQERLKHAGLSINISRLLQSDANQLLVTDEGFFDFKPQYVLSDKQNMQDVLVRITEKGNGRVATKI